MWIRQQGSPYVYWPFSHFPYYIPYPGYPMYTTSDFMNSPNPFFNPYESYSLYGSSVTGTVTKQNDGAILFPIPFI
ncbi:hypothetical protein EDD68_11549 [Melghiribacillus thermohalophilus]|uniref:Uncharacterized protein n=1 Tax=Melghiribacillus thermohalophilus TaxID=1324956 RepID=A0A4R3MU62_9BACI|nr:hypothetical protein EDD68_11549 [Melghiribacillus thermohalophilus]